MCLVLYKSFWAFDCGEGLGRRRAGARGVSIDLDELRNADERRDVRDNKFTKTESL